MYGKNVEALLNSAAARTGDLVRMVSEGQTIEGEVMPSTESNNENLLIIKLANGYNIGVNPIGYRLEKLKSAQGAISFPQAKASRKEGLEDVSLIYTGGTIGSRVDYKTGGVYMLTKPEELLYSVPEIADIANVSILPLMSIASEDMGALEWGRIADTVAKELNGGARGIVITHGTDTMHYTAAALSFMLWNLNAPVVLTGSQRSSDRGSSDAFMNLICATAAAARSDIAEVGICMHENSSDEDCIYIRGSRARKMHTSRRDAFRAINDRPIARIRAAGGIEYMNEHKRIGGAPQRELAVKKGFDGKVALLKAYPNSDPEIIRFYTQKGYRGIIIEGTGLGHVPVSDAKKGWLPAIREAIDGGTIIGMTSQCVYGRVNTNVYRNLRMISATGVTYCEDMAAETALVKLGWLLGNFNAERARELLPKNLAGEIKGRSEYDEFLM